MRYFKIGRKIPKLSLLRITEFFNPAINWQLRKNRKSIFRVEFRIFHFQTMNSRIQPIYKFCLKWPFWTQFSFSLWKRPLNRIVKMKTNNSRKKIWDWKIKKEKIIEIQPNYDQLRMTSPEGISRNCS